MRFMGYKSYKVYFFYSFLKKTGRSKKLGNGCNIALSDAPMSLFVSSAVLAPVSRHRKGFFSNKEPVVCPEIPGCFSPKAYLCLIITKFDFY